MKIYFAPMEGITGHIYRSIHHKYFTSVDRYFTPFIVTTQHCKLKNRELNDILPENNQGISVIPQILSNNARDFIETAKIIKELGYDEINLNLGCPSGTVVAKHKGSGFLAKPEELDRFLFEIFEADVTKLSIKTRIGKEREEEFQALLQIFQKYPLTELIIHPRLQVDYYKNSPNLEIYKEATKQSSHHLCYNGDLFTANQIKTFEQTILGTDCVMIGRGLLANPNLAAEYKLGETLTLSTVRAFHEELLLAYQEELSGDRNLLFKMKELWFYLHHSFEDSEKFMKKIRKTERLTDYKAVINQLFEEKPLISSGSGFKKQV